MSESFSKLIRYGRSAVNLVRRPDTVGLRPIHMQLEPTSRCNLACPMCLRQDVFGRGMHMSYALFERIFKQILPLHITLNGQGEPLLNRDIFRMIELAEGKGARVNLTSNGNFLKRHSVRLIESGLTLLSVSLDTVDRDTYKIVRSRDLLDQTLEGLAMFQAEKRKRGIEKPAVQLFSVMMAATLKHAHAFVDKAHELGINSVLFQPMALFGKWENIELMGPYADRELYRTTLEELESYSKERGKDFYYNVVNWVGAAISTSTPPLKRLRGNFPKGVSRYAGKQRPRCRRDAISRYLCFHGVTGPCLNLLPCFPK